MLIDYGCGPLEARMGVKTMTVYEQEFGRDIIQDLFGRAVIRKQAEDDVEFSVDYRDTNWTALVRVLWAALRTADESVPPFEVWGAGIEELDLNAVGDALFPEAYRVFFHTGVSGTQE